MADPTRDVAPLDWLEPNEDDDDTVVPDAPDRVVDDVFAQVGARGPDRRKRKSSGSFFYRPESVETGGSAVWDVAETDPIAARPVNEVSVEDSAAEAEALASGLGFAEDSSPQVAPAAPTFRVEDEPEPTEPLMTGLDFDDDEDSTVIASGFTQTVASGRTWDTEVPADEPQLWTRPAASPRRVDDTERAAEADSLLSGLDVENGDWVRPAAAPTQIHDYSSELMVGVDFDDADGAVVAPAAFTSTAASGHTWESSDADDIDFDPIQETADEAIDLDSLQIEADEVHQRRGKRKRWLIVAAIVLVAVLVFVLSRVLFGSAKADEPVSTMGWLSKVKTMPAPSAAPAWTTSDPAWTIEVKRDTQFAVFSAGVLQLTGNKVQVLDGANPKKVLATSKLSAPIDYTLEATSVSGPVMGWVSGDKLFYYSDGSTKIRSWDLPESASVSSNANSAFKVRAGNGDDSFTAVPGKTELQKIDVSREDLVPASVTPQGQVISVQRSRARIVVSAPDGDDAKTVDLKEPFASAKLHSIVHTDRNLVAALWEDPDSSSIYTLTTHLMSSGKAVSSVPVKASQATGLTWTTGQGGTTSYYGRYVFDSADGTAKSKLGAQEVVGGASGDLAWAPSANGQIIYDHTRKSGGATWESTPRILGTTQNSLVVTKVSTGHLQAHRKPAE